MSEARPGSNVPRIVLVAVGVATLIFAAAGAFGSYTLMGVTSGVVMLLVAATAK